MTNRAIMFLIVALSVAQAEPIRLHPKNPHYFLFRGKTVALISSGEHYGAVMNADFDYRRYLAALEADGMTYTRLCGGSDRETRGKAFGIQRSPLATLPGSTGAPAATPKP